MNEIPLPGPPNYEYKATAPFWICQVERDGTAKTWVMHTLGSAILRFWLCDHTPWRRVLVDSYGVTILGTDSTDPKLPRMSGSREAAEATLEMVTNSNIGSIESQSLVLVMIDGLRSLDGQAL